MKKFLINLITVGLPLALGVYVIWYQYDALSAQQIENIKQSFREADYFWVWVSVIVGLLSHISRAYRWKYMLAPLNYKPRLLNSFFAVMISYIANLAFNRVGEATRCAVMTKYEGAPFGKLFGTVIAERVADLVILGLIVVVVVLIQLDVIGGLVGQLLNQYLQDRPLSDLLMKLGMATAIVIGGGWILWRLVRHSDHPVFARARASMAGLMDGMLAIIRMEDNWKFILHTVFIWAMYVLMFWTPFLSMPGTADASFGAVLSSFVVASMSIAVVQGGIGVYPVAVGQALILYGIPQEEGLALGWLVWTAQTLMLVMFGGVSLLLMPIYNRGRNKVVATDTQA